MESHLPPPTTAPRSSDRGPDASQFLFPISAPLPARDSSLSSRPGPLAPLRLPLSRNRPMEISWQVMFPMGSVGCETVRWQRNPVYRAGVAGMPGPSQPEPSSFPPPRAFHLEGSSRDCLPGSLSGFTGWRSLFPSSSLPARAAVCVMSRRTRPVSEVSPMPGVLFSQEPIRG